MERVVYLDHAASTPLDMEVFSAMEPYFKEHFGNPSSFHMKGKVARDAVEEARGRVAGVLEVRADEIVFTGSGTESDNLAILGIARANKAQGKHIISCKAEHEAVLEALEALEKEGFEITLLTPDRDGRVNEEDVLDAIRKDTILVTLMYANNEIGTVHPLADIGKAIASYRKEQNALFPLFHTDACQAPGMLPLNVASLHVDALTLNGSKMYGPKGVGVLYVRRGIKVSPLVYGGSQEGGKRPGTENVAGIVGLGVALERAEEQREVLVERLTSLRDALISGIEERIQKIRVNGHRVERLANNVNISFMDVEGEALLLYLDAKGVYGATGSACTSQSLDPSHVILALGVPYEVAHGSIRFTLGRSTTKEDIDYVLEVLPALVERLRAMSPVNVDPKYYV